MNIDKLTIGEAKDLARMFGANTTALPFSVGDKVFIRTVTHYHTGRIVNIVGAFLVLEDAAWIASTGRFADALKKGEFDQVEPIEGLCKVNTGAIIDAFEWKGELPRVQK